MRGVKVGKKMTLRAEKKGLDEVSLTDPEDTVR